MKLRLLVLVLLLSFFVQAQTSSKPTIGEAEAFMNHAEAQLREMSVKANRAGWVQENFITDDTQALSADANDQITALTEDLVEQAKHFDGLQMPADLERRFMLLKLSLTAPAPHDPALRKEMTQIASSLDGDYERASTAASPMTASTSPPSRRS